MKRNRGTWKNLEVSKMHEQRDDVSLIRTNEDRAFCFRPPLTAASHYDIAKPSSAAVAQASFSYFLLSYTLSETIS